MGRSAAIFGLAVAAAIVCGLPASAGPASRGSAGESSNFATCLEGFWTKAHAAGISRPVFDAALADVTADPKVAAQTARQIEFSLPVWDYLAVSASPRRIAKGQAEAERYASVIADLEKQYGVDRRAIMGVWGMESNFGTDTGGMYVVRALATLACLPYRPELFGDELIQALAILQQGHVSRDSMRGSWAGAMGQTQFMPSSFGKYAVDYDGDGRKDIWTDVPDALASTANFLRLHGWTEGLPWGFEVRLPAGFDVGQHGRSTFRDFSAWARLGLKRRDGLALPGQGEAALYLPAGINGPALLITRNYAVIKSYNNSDNYVPAAAHLGDRIYGGAPIAAVWPRGQKQLTHAQRLEIQQRLTRIGYDVGKHDGRLGEKTSEAIRAFQLKVGMVADGYATDTVLARLKAEAH